MTRNELEDLTVADLRDLASEADVDGRSSMTKSELVDALAEPEPDETVEPAAPPTQAGGIDAALVAARDELRAREAAEAEAVEPRPIVGDLDPVLAAQAEATRQADAASETSATEAPSATS